MLILDPKCERGMRQITELTDCLATSFLEVLRYSNDGSWKKFKHQIFSIRRNKKLLEVWYDHFSNDLFH